MKDFDAERAERATGETDDRSFILGGETFAIRPISGVRPDALAAASRITKDSRLDEDIASIDETILGFLKDEDARSRYLALRQRVDDPITFADLFAVANWMVVEETEGRPTEQPSPSIPGSGPTAPSLTAVSDSPPVAQAG